MIALNNLAAVKLTNGDKQLARTLLDHAVQNLSSTLDVTNPILITAKSNLLHISRQPLPLDYLRLKR